MGNPRNSMGWEYTIPPNPRQVRDALFMKLAKERREGDARRAESRAERRRRRNQSS